MNALAQESRTTWREIVAELVPRFASRAARVDADDEFVAESYAELRASGLVAAAVPAELGGLGASHGDLCEMLRCIGYACGSTGLAFSMHTHPVAALAWRWRNGHAPVEDLLRQVAEERIVLLTTLGSDWLPGAGVASRTDGGYLVNARKRFASGAPAADLMLTSAVAEVDGRREVLHFAVPLRAPGVRIDSNWKTLGMRATGSHDIVLENVFVADDEINERRKPGVWHPLFHAGSMIALPLIFAVYVGIAQAARDRALQLARRRRETPRLLDLVGQLLNETRAAEVAHAEMLASAAKDEPGFATTDRIFSTRALCGRAVLRTVELALEVAGGPGYFRDAGLERLFRDAQGCRFHPLQDGDQRRLAAALALGLDPDAA